ncbi:site-specific integrase [Bartonella sp. HY038]|uniref:tyrosine-type recombinase/integrase n=1 Tax=Bartonella sp. HY038 TaxID=2759660 RepID=UPI0015F94D13|nr:site-specific integrase [Bartonella sp. HY038]
MNYNKKADMKNITVIQNINGSDTYRVQIRQNGNRYPAKTFNTLKEAKAYRDRCQHESYENTNPVAKPNSTERFRDTIKRFRDDLHSIRRKEHSVISDMSRLNSFLKREKWFCSLITSNITDMDINKFISSRKKAVTFDTVLRELTLLKGVFRYSMRRLRIKDNPFNSEFIDRPAPSEPRDRILSSEEREKLIAACKKSKSKWLTYVVNFLLETGIRRGELTSLNFSDVKVNADNTVQVLIRDVKNSRKPNQVINKVIPLSSVAVKIINDLKASAIDDRIFPITGDAITRMFARATKQADIPNYRIHDLRHERITSLANANTPPHVIQKITGHRDVRSVNRYINPSVAIANEYLKQADAYSFRID